MSRGSLRILVGISNFGVKNGRYLERLLREYRSMPYDIDICVFSDMPKRLGDDVEVIVGLPQRDPWSLPHAHKRVFAERLGRYDLFIYSEDDTLVTRGNIDAFLGLASVLPDDRIPGFLRYEVDGDGRRSYSTIHSHYHWEPDSVRTFGSHCVARLTNDHAGCYLATRKQLHRAVASGGYLVPPSAGRYDKLCTAATDIYTRCGMQKVIAVSNIDAFALHHLPNAYIGRCGIDETLLRVQVKALMDIHEGRKPGERLIETRTALGSTLFDKKYFGRARADIAGAMPARCRRVLSVGCTAGATEAHLRERGHEVWGIPVDAVVGACAAARGVRVLEPNLDRALERVGAGRFDCILFADVLHHFRDPVAVLKRCVPCLDRNGCIVAAVPNHAHISVWGKGIARRSRFADLRLLHDYERSRLRFSSLGALRGWFVDTGLESVRLAVSDLRLTASRRLGWRPGFLWSDEGGGGVRGALGRTAGRFVGGRLAMQIIATGWTRC